MLETGLLPKHDENKEDRKCPACDQRREANPAPARLKIERRSETEAFPFSLFSFQVFFSFFSEPERGKKEKKALFIVRIHSAKKI